MVCLSGAGLPRLSWKKAVKRVVVVIVVSKFVVKFVSYTNNRKRLSVGLCHGSARLIWAPYGCGWCARGDPGYGRKWAWLARRCRCTARQAPGRNGRCAWTGYKHVLANISRSRYNTPIYGRNGTALLQIPLRMQQARRFYRWRGESSPTCVVHAACGGPVGLLLGSATHF